MRGRWERLCAGFSNWGIMVNRCASQITISLLLLPLISSGGENQEFSVGFLEGEYHGWIYIRRGVDLDPRSYPSFLAEEGLHEIAVSARSHRYWINLNVQGKGHSQWTIPFVGGDLRYLEGRDEDFGRYLWIRLLVETYDLENERETVEERYPGIGEQIEELQAKARYRISDFKPTIDLETKGYQINIGNNDMVMYENTEGTSPEISFEMRGKFSFLNNELPLSLTGKEGEEGVLRIGGREKERLIYTLRVEKVECGFGSGNQSCREETEIEWLPVGTLVIENPTSNDERLNR